MIYKFRVISPEAEDFCIDVEIQNTKTFKDLHNAIQNACKYDKKEVASFYLTNDSWEKDTEICLYDMTGEPNSGVLTMNDAPLNEYLCKKKEKLLYVFDFFSDRAFFIELCDIYTPKNDVKYPNISTLTGTPPPQILEDETLDSMIAEEFRSLESDGFEKEDDMFDDDMFGEALPDEFDEYNDFGKQEDDY